MTRVEAAPVRQGVHSVTPYIAVVEGDKLLEFLKHAFRAEEVFRSPSPAGSHAEVRIGNSRLMVGWGEQVRGCERLGAFHVHVPDCDEAYRRALEVGAASMGEPADQPYGERSGFVRDPFGSNWYIATRFPSTVVYEGAGDIMPYAHPREAKQFIEFLAQAFDAQQLGVYEEGGRVAHAAVRMGASIVEMGEPAGPYQPFASRFYLHVDDCDAWYRRAIAAGAASVEEPTDRLYGHRTAMVVDPFGNEWIPASELDRLKGS